MADENGHENLINDFMKLSRGKNLESVLAMHLLDGGLQTPVLQGRDWKQ